MKDIVIKDIKRKTSIPMSVIKKAVAYAHAVEKERKAAAKGKPKNKPKTV